MGKARSIWRVARWLVVAGLIAANLAVFYAIRKTESVQEAFVEAFETIPDIEDVLDEPPAPETRDPITILVLGSDSRENLPEELLDDFGHFAGERADVIMLLQLIPETGEMMLLSIPRDLKVDIEGHGSGKINAAYTFGGAPLMVDTVRTTMQLPIHHYLEVDFVGFSGLVDQLGGVTLDFPYAARDLKSGLAVEAGEQALDGQTALAYARSRSYQELQDGRWTSVDANDIGRTQRQQDLVLAILNSVKSPTIVLEAERVIGKLAGYVTVDASFLDIDFIDLGLTYRSLGSDDISRLTLPTESIREDGVWYEIPVEPDASTALAAFAAPGLTASAGGAVFQPIPPTTTSPPSPEDLTLQVLNGNGVSGAASLVADELKTLGFSVSQVGDAEEFIYEETIIVAPTLVVAELIATGLGYGKVETGLPPDGIDAVVIVGG